MKAAIFDLDGTLLDSMGLWETYGTSYLKMKGYNAPDSLNEKFRAFSLKEAAIYCKQLLKSDLDINTIMADINKVAEESYFYTLPLKPYAKEYLSYLKKQGFKLCVATATDRYLTEAALKRCGILEFFEFIITCTEAGYGKSSPVIFRKALSLLGARKSETLVFEDALHAVSTAKADGFLVVGIYDKYEKHPEELKKLADKYIFSYKELLI